MIQKEIQQEIINFMNEHEDNTVTISFAKIAVKMPFLHSVVEQDEDKNYILKVVVKERGRYEYLDEIRIYRDSSDEQYDAVTETYIPFIQYQFHQLFDQPCYETNESVAFNMSNIEEIVFEDKYGKDIKVYGYTK